MNELWGLLSESPKNAPSRAGTAADRLPKDAKRRAEQVVLETFNLGGAELANARRSKHLGEMQSNHGETLVAVNHRIGIA